MGRDSTDKRVYSVSRGEEYSCLVVVEGDDAVWFRNVKYPASATDRMVETLLDDAEREALKLFRQEKEA